MTSSAREAVLPRKEVGNPVRHRGGRLGDGRSPLNITEGFGMLVLSRKLGEKIRIGENIWVTVVDIDRGKIRLGVEAPRNVPIYRQELLPLVNPPAPNVEDKA